MSEWTVWSIKGDRNDRCVRTRSCKFTAKLARHLHTRIPIFRLSVPCHGLKLNDSSRNCCFKKKRTLIRPVSPTSFREFQLHTRNNVPKRAANKSRKTEFVFRFLARDARDARVVEIKREKDDNWERWEGKLTCWPEEPAVQVPQAEDTYKLS